MVTAVGHAAGTTHTRARTRVSRWHLPPGRALVCRQPVQLLRGGPPLSPALKGYSSVPSRAMHRHTRTHTHTHLMANKSSRIQGPCSFPSYALLTCRYQRPSIVLPSPLVKDRFSPPMPQGSTGNLCLLSAPSLQR